MKQRLHHTAFLAFGISCGLCAGSFAGDELVEPTGKITHSEARRLAEERNPELNSARLETRASDGIVSQAAARLNPSLSFEAENFGGKNELNGFENAEYVATIEQTIEVGGKRGKRMHIASAERQLAGFELEAKRRDILAETSRRFVNVLGAQEHLALAVEAAALSEDFVKAVAARVAAGKVPPMELETANGQLAQKRIAFEQAKGDLAVARIQMAMQWGGSCPMFESVAGDLMAPPALPPFAEAVSQLPANPDVARWTIELELAKAVLERERVAQVPDVTFTAGYRRASPADSDTLLAGVSLPLPLFDRNQGNVRAAVSRMASAMARQRAAELLAATDLATAYQLLVTAANKASALRTDVIPRIKVVSDAITSGYTQGKYSYLEVLDSQRTLVETRANYIDSLISVHTALANLERIAGAQSQIK